MLRTWTSYGPINLEDFALSFYEVIDYKVKTIYMRWIIKQHNAVCFETNKKKKLV